MFSAISMWTWVLANVCFAYSAYSAPSTDKKHHHLCFCPVISPSHNISSFGFILRLGSYDAGCSSFLQWTYIMCVDTGYRIVDIDPSFWFTPENLILHSGKYLNCWYWSFVLIHARESDSSQWQIFKFASTEQEQKLYRQPHFAMYSPKCFQKL